MRFIYSQHFESRLTKVDFLKLKFYFFFTMINILKISLFFFKNVQ